MPFYRITIWLKNKRKPVSGIRFIEQSNIDIVNIQMQKQARIHYNDSLIIDSLSIIPHSFFICPELYGENIPEVRQLSNIKKRYWVSQEKHKSLSLF